MLKQHATVYRRLMIAMDVVLVGASFFLAYYIRFTADHLSAIDVYLWILPVVMIIWGNLLYAFGMYSSFRLKGVGGIIQIIFKAAFLGFLIFGCVLYLFKMYAVSRALILLIFGLATYLILLEKVVLIIVLRHFRRQGFNFRNVLIVGTSARAQKFITELDQHRELGLKIYGLIDEPHESSRAEVHGHKVIGTLSDIPQLLRDHPIDSVIFIVPRNWLGKIEEPILFCETVGVSVSVAVDFFDLEFTTSKESRLFGFPLLTFERTSDRIWQLLLKRMMDIVLSGAALLVLSPLFAVLAVLIKMTSPGPVFFRQKRSGLNGRQFNFYKFRTMSADAESQLEDLRQHNEMDGPVFKMHNDPRITTLGKFLRKFSLDELPQLWNVFRGEMSLVGPRPPIPDEVARYDHWQRRRLSMRPGLTCIWQISGRNNIKDFNHWMKLDLQYIDHWSLWRDIVILLKTVPVVILARGAK